MMRSALAAIVGAAAIGTAVPARAELTVEAAGQLPSEAAADVQGAPSIAKPEQVTPDPLAPNSAELSPSTSAPTQAKTSATEIAPEIDAETETESQATGAAPLNLEPLDPSVPPPAPLSVEQQSSEQPASEQPSVEAEFPAVNRRLVIRLDQRRVFVYEGETSVVSYPIAVGRAGWETPKGEFEVFQMLKDPSWQHPWNGSIVPPGPDNPLGRRWIGFWTDGVNSIGFHGTPNESLVGQAVSHGCIRMKNADVANLFAMVDHGTTVIVE